MATVGTLAVNLVARTGRFEKSLTRAIRRLRSFSSSIAGVGAKASALAAVVAGGGLGLLVKKSFESIDATAKLADRIGDTTEAVSGLQHAAELTGAGTALLNQSLDVMSKRIGEAAGGTGEAKQALEQLNLSVEDLLRLKPSDQFKVIAERIKGLATQAEKAAVVSDLFSRAGLKLANTLELGEDGLRKTAEEATKLGLTFNRIDASKVEAANDSVTRLQAVFLGAARVIAIVLAPIVDLAASKLINLGTEGEGSANRIRSAFSSTLETVAAVADVAEVVRIGFVAIGNAITRIITLNGGLLYGLDALGRLTDKLGLTENAAGGAALLHQSIVDTVNSNAERIQNFVPGSASEAARSFISEANARSAENASAAVNGSRNFNSDVMDEILNEIQRGNDLMARGLL